MEISSTADDPIRVWFCIQFTNCFNCFLLHRQQYQLTALAQIWFVKLIKLLSLLTAAKLCTLFQQMFYVTRPWPWKSNQVHLYEKKVRKHFATGLLVHWIFLPAKISDRRESLVAHFIVWRVEIGSKPTVIALSAWRLRAKILVGCRHCSSNVFVESLALFLLTVAPFIMALYWHLSKCHYGIIYRLLHSSHHNKSKV